MKMNENEWKWIKIHETDDLLYASQDSKTCFKKLIWIAI